MRGTLAGAWGRSVLVGLLLTGFLLTAGCTNRYGGVGGGPSDEIKFVDRAKSNTDVPDSPKEINLYNLEGSQVSLGDYIGKKRTVLVITRGNTIPICPYCSTQTSRYVMFHSRFVDRDAEVLLVYPIESEFTTDGIDAFLEKAQQDHYWKQDDSKLPILIDAELKLVDFLGIRKDLSKPSTYVFNEKGEVTFAYVGQSIADRPSVQSILDHLDETTDKTEAVAN